MDIWEGGARSSVKYFTKLYCSFMKSPNERKHFRVGGSSSPLTELFIETKDFFITIIGLLYFTWVRAEHSTYLTARNSFANFSPISRDNGFCLFLASFSIVPASSLKSICVPTSKNGVFWQWCVISGTHWKAN